MAAQLIRRRPTLRATGTHSPARSDSSEEQQQVLAFFLEGSEVLALVNADIAALQSVLQQKPSAQHGQPGIAESQDASIILQVPASDPWVTAAWALSMALALAGPMQLKVSLYSVLANAAGSIPIVSASQMRTILDSIVMFAEADIIRYALPLSHSKHDNVLAARATSALIVPMDGQSVQASDGLDVHACQQLLWTAAAACASGHASHLLLPAACNHTPTSMEPKPAAAAPQQLPHPEQSSHGVKTSQVMQTGAPEMSAAAAPFSACGADAICAHIVAAVLYTRAGQSRAARASVSAARCLWQVEVGSQTLFDEVFGWLVGGSDT